MMARGSRQTPSSIKDDIMVERWALRALRQLRAKVNHATVSAMLFLEWGLDDYHLWARIVHRTNQLIGVHNTGALGE